MIPEVQEQIYLALVIWEILLAKRQQIRAGFSACFDMACQIPQLRGICCSDVCPIRVSEVSENLFNFGFPFL